MPAPVEFKNVIAVAKANVYFDGKVVSHSLLLPDGFYTYIPRAVRMAQTGTLTGNPFDTLGIDSLGSQSFFHGFFLPEIDVRLLHSFDAVGCFAMALILAAELMLWWRLPASAGVLAVLLFMAINPQAVNVSSLYSGAAVAMTTLCFGTALIVRLPFSNGSLRRRHEILLALLLALLIALKLTLALFAAAYLVALCAALLFAGVPKKTLMMSAATVLLAIIVFVAPWVILHVPIYHRARVLAAPFADQAVIAAKYSTIVASDISQLFHFRQLFWGDSTGAYLWLALLCVGVAVAAWISARRKCNSLQARSSLAIAAAVAAVLATYLINAHLFSVDNAIRYSSPILMAGSVMSFFLLLKQNRMNRGETPRRLIVGACAAMTLTILVFGKSFVTRILRASEKKTLISFPVDDGYVRYCEMILRNDRPYLQTIQSKIDPKTKVLVWTAAPFHLDFSRNQLLTVSDPGLISPLAYFPAGISADALRQYLRRWDIRYVWLQLPGAGMKTVEMMKPQLQNRSAIERKLADYNIYFREILTPVLAQSRLVYQDKNMALFDFGGPDARPAAFAP